MLIKILSLLFIPAFLLTSPAQTGEPILWNFEYDNINPSMVCIKATATLAPGWHIYSQFLDEGGPIPTKLILESNDPIQCIGQAMENGNPIQFYDGLYGMNIVWYSNTVSFSQAVKISHSPIEVKGSLSFMTCNEHLCIPGSCSFSIPIKTLRRAP